ncbi:hypothetical protein [Maribacter sp. IgM3_T14_3]|uniref:hypothetical protein n=1 Tax=Maribacter sp. IgM3_T14_3 TaxID=3415140 RepID=UPI003C702E6F
MVKIFVRVRVPVYFVETNLGIDVLAGKGRPEILGIETGVGVEEQALDWTYNKKVDI